MILVIGLLFLLLTVVAGMRPSEHVIRPFELERLAAQGDTHAQVVLRQKKLSGTITALLRIATSGLIGAFALVSVVFFGWLYGCILTLLAVVAYQPATRLSSMRAWAQALYARFESKLIAGLENYPILRMFRGDTVEEKTVPIQSRDEFFHEVEVLESNILHKREKDFIRAGLSFNKQKVASIMTEREAIVSISQSELLGPLALDELHKTGHSRFPVISGDIDSIIGVVDIDNLVTLVDKKSPRARDVMSQPIYRVRQTQTLEEVLAVFLEAKQNLLIVTDKDDKTVGLVCLEDVITALFGRTLVSKNFSHRAQ